MDDTPSSACRWRVLAGTTPWFYCKSGYNLLVEKKKSEKYYFEDEPIHIFVDIVQTTQIWSYVLHLLNLNRFPRLELAAWRRLNATHLEKENLPFNFPFFSYLPYWKASQQVSLMGFCNKIGHSRRFGYQKCGVPCREWDLPTPGIIMFNLSRKKKGLDPAIQSLSNHVSVLP